MKRLIVNADDVGADEARNEGIFDAINAGVVTSISVLPNAPALEDAVHRIRLLDSGQVSIGIHLNLSEGKPLSSGLKYLVGSDGNFLGKAVAHRLLADSRNEELNEEIQKEVDAQILFLQSFGFPIDHLDGHQHIHIFSAVVAIAAEAANRSRIRWIRIPEELPDSIHPFASSSAIMSEAHFFSSLAESARPVFSRMGNSIPDHFRGLYLKGRLPSNAWREFLDAMPDGLTEFMVHPGRVAADPDTSSPFSGFSTIEREMELLALTDGCFQATLTAAGVMLVRFPETGLI